MNNSGGNMYRLLCRLFPICRSITGDGVRETLAILREELPEMAVHEIPSGTQVFDWTIPDEWNIRAARLEDPEGKIIADFADSNLRVMGYSEPVDVVLPLEQLQEHLYSRPELPDAIPYVTSYYKRNWGFCLKHGERERLRPGLYHAVIDSTLKPGHLTYGEVILPGETEQEIFLSTYICHPSLANNELSGPVVATEAIKWLRARPRRYTYRAIFIPETIGSITYLSRNLSVMKERMIAGLVLTCIGDDRAYSYLPSRNGNTLADRAALHVLRSMAPNFVHHSFLDRGSDERQYCSPGVDLPVCSLMRTKYGMYPEYHTSLDNLDFVTPKGLRGGFELVRAWLAAIEEDRVYSREILCEPCMGRRGLYPSVSMLGSSSAFTRDFMDILAYVDGKTSLLEIAEIINRDIESCAASARVLNEHELIYESHL